MVFAMLHYLKDNNLDLELAKKMLWELYRHPKMDFDSVLTSINFEKVTKENILSHIPFLKEKFDEIKLSENKEHETRWIMGELKKIAIGNIDLRELKKEIIKKK